MSGKLKMERGSANVFRDLGFPEAEAGTLLLRSQLVNEAQKIAQRRTKALAAKRLGVTHSRLNDLLRGKIDKFSLDALIIMLITAGMQIEVRVRNAV